MAIDGVTIRRGVPGDAKGLAEFAARAFVDAFGAGNRPEDLAMHLARTFGTDLQAAELADADVTTLLVVEGDVIAGYAQLRGGQAPDCVTHAAALELRRFYIDRTQHGRGVAQALMQATKAAAAARGARHLWLSVFAKNPRAIAFYRKEGFAQVGTAYFFVGSDRQDDLVLVAPVERPAEGSAPNHGG